MLLDYRSIFEIFTLAFRKKKTEKKGKWSCPEENDWQINSFIWNINFQNNDGHANTDLGPSPKSTTARFTETA